MEGVGKGSVHVGTAHLEMCVRDSEMISKRSEVVDQQSFTPATLQSAPVKEYKSMACRKIELHSSASGIHEAEAVAVKNETNESDVIFVREEQKSECDDELQTDMKAQGFIHVPVRGDGKCCYHAMTNVVNIHAMINSKKKLPLKKTTDVLRKLERSLQLLLKSGVYSKQLRGELSSLLETSKEEKHIRVMISKMIKKIKGFLSHNKQHLPARLWGETRMFGLLSLVYQFSISQYNLATLSRKNQKLLKKHRKAVCTRMNSNQLSDYPEVAKLIDRMIIKNPSPALVEESYIIAFNNAHFDVWLNVSQAKTLKKSIISLMKKRDVIRENNDSILFSRWLELCHDK